MNRFAYLSFYMKCVINTVSSAVFCVHSLSEVKDLIGGMSKTKRANWWNEEKKRADWCTCFAHFSTALFRPLQNNRELK